mmetsp:Transcript_11525/g.18893  ORF Transcript_11525/g.18893 Transcript_11525/m.18893 type:complete len:103 (+) Transcript_11525:46-354(+)
MISLILGVVGALLLIHAAYSYRHYNQLLVQLRLPETNEPPIDVMIELIVGFVCVLVSQLSTLKLKPMRISPQIRAKTFDEAMTNVDYMVFNHRGKFLADRLR